MICVRNAAVVLLVLLLAGCPRPAPPVPPEPPQPPEPVAVAAQVVVIYETETPELGAELGRLRMSIPGDEDTTLTILPTSATVPDGSPSPLVTELTVGSDSLPRFWIMDADGDVIETGPFTTADAVAALLVKWGPTE